MGATRETWEPKRERGWGSEGGRREGLEVAYFEPRVLLGAVSAPVTQRGGYEGESRGGRSK